MKELLLMLPDAFLFSALCVLVLVAAFSGCRRLLSGVALVVVVGYLCCVSYQTNHLVELNMGISSHILSLFNLDASALGMKKFAGYVTLAILVFLESIGFKREVPLVKQNKDGVLLILFSVLGASLMCGSSHFLMSYLGLELLSLALVVVIAWGLEKPQLEASVKYFLLSALASGILLFGVSLIYGATGHLNFVSSALVRVPFHSLYIVGQIFLVAGLAFKLGWAPFHFWVSDVYASARWYTLVALGSLSKIGVVGFMMRLIDTGVLSLSPAPAWAAQLIVVLSVFSILFGNVMAVQQKNMRRLLAYSSVANMGFVGLALVCQTGAPFYLAVYVLNSLVVATILFHHFGHELEINIEHLKGFALKYPYQGALFALAMLSMAGVPMTPGFWAKLHVFKAFFAASSMAFSIFIIIATLVGTFYYLRVVKYLYEETAINSELHIDINTGAGSLFPQGISSMPVVTFSSKSINPIFFLAGVISLVMPALFPDSLLEWSQKITGTHYAKVSLEQANRVPPVTALPNFSASVVSPPHRVDALVSVPLAHGK